MSVFGRALLSAIELLPEKDLSRSLRRLAELPAPLAIKAFARIYGVNVDEAEKPIHEYRTLLDFFTRRLRSGVRPLDPDPDAVLSPADGWLDVAGPISRGRLIQAKGSEYALSALLGSEERALAYEGGLFATIYLSPRDYHRVHCPLAAEVVGATYVPGALFPVNANAVQHVDGLFARNERLITHLVSDRFGPFEEVMVGATGVGHMTVAYDPSLLTNAGGREVLEKTYAPPVSLARGGELGVFELGSTVIVILSPAVELVAPVGAAIKVGQRLALRRSAGNP